jgi:hypothetical protein
MQKNEEGSLYTLVLCHSKQRCADLKEFVEGLVEFSPGIVDITDLTNGNFNETIMSLKLQA